MARREDVLGNRYGRFVVTGEASMHGHHRYVFVRCDCGTEKSVSLDSLRGGISASCGCLLRDMMAARTKHGFARRGPKPSEYTTWYSMIRRCVSPTDWSFPRYGGRGITVCDRWRDSFAAFYADMGPKPTPKHSIDRIDNNGPYSPENCRWATPTEQGRNSRRNRVIEAFGERLCPSAWEEKTGVLAITAQRRVARGVSPEVAVTAKHRVDLR